MKVLDKVTVQLYVAYAEYSVRVYVEFHVNPPWFVLYLILGVIIELLCFYYIITDKMLQVINKINYCDIVSKNCKILHILTVGLRCNSVFYIIIHMKA